MANGTFCAACDNKVVRITTLEDQLAEAAAYIETEKRLTSKQHYQINDLQTQVVNLKAQLAEANDRVYRAVTEREEMEIELAEATARAERAERAHWKEYAILEQRCYKAQHSLETMLREANEQLQDAQMDLAMLDQYRNWYSDLKAENARLREAAIRKDCDWVYEEDTDMYETGCGRAFCFIDGDPEENLFRFCYHCGGNLVLAALEPNHE